MSDSKLPVLQEPESSEFIPNNIAQQAIIEKAQRYLAHNNLSIASLNAAIEILTDCLILRSENLTPKSKKRDIQIAIDQGLEQRQLKIEVYIDTIKYLKKPNHLPFQGENYQFFDLAIDKGDIEKAQDELKTASVRKDFTECERLTEMLTRNEYLIDISTRKILIDTLELKSLDEVDVIMQIVGSFTNKSKIIRGFIATQILEHFNIFEDCSAVFFSEISIEKLAELFENGVASQQKNQLIASITNKLTDDLNITIELRNQIFNIITHYFNQVENSAINWTRSPIYQQNATNTDKPYIYWERQRHMFNILPLNALSIGERFIMNIDDFATASEGQLHIWMDSIILLGHQIPSVVDLIRARESLKGSKGTFNKSYTVDLALKMLREHESIRNNNPRLIQNLTAALDEIMRSMHDIPPEPIIGANIMFNYSRKYGSLGSAEKTYERRIATNTKLNEVLLEGSLNEQLSEYINFQLDEQATVIRAIKKERNSQEAILRGCHIFNFLIQNDHTAKEKYNKGGQNRLDMLTEQYTYFMSLNRITSTEEFNKLAGTIATDEFYKYIEALIDLKKPGSDNRILQLAKLPRDVTSTISWVIGELRNAIKAQEELIVLGRKLRNTEQHLDDLKKLRAQKNDPASILQGLQISREDIVRDLSIRLVPPNMDLDLIETDYENFSKVFNDLKIIVPRYFDLRGIILDENLTGLDAWKQKRITAAEGDTVKLNRIQEVYQTLVELLNNKNIPLTQAYGLSLDEFIRILTTRANCLEAYANMPKIEPLKAFLQQKRSQRKLNTASERMKKTYTATVARIKYLEDQYANANELLLRSMQALGLAIPLNNEQ